MRVLGAVGEEDDCDEEDDDENDKVDGFSDPSLLWSLFTVF
jgi:hypothetical protein